MNVKIIPEQCIACGLCRTYNQLFDYDIDGLVCFVSDETTLITSSDISLIKAAKNCPTGAIKVN